MSDTIQLHEYGLKEVVENLNKIGYIVAFRVTDSAVGYIGAEGRRAADKVLDNDLWMGVWQKKWKQRKGGKGSYVERKFSRWDESVGGYVSTTRKSDKSGAFRMTNFTYETAHYISKTHRYTRRVPSAQALSKARFTSQMANLWENPTRPYRKASPLFRRVGEPNSGRWGAGEVRPGLGFWGRATSAVRNQVSKAVVRTENKFRAELAKEGLNK